jgi:hypothetical protein
MGPRGSLDADVRRRALASVGKEILTDVFLIF